MNSRMERKRRAFATWVCAVAGGLLAIYLPLLVQAQVLSLNVAGPNGEAVTGFRWLIEEDTTKPVTLGAPAVPGQNLSLSFHTSYAPVVANGDDTNTTVTLDPAKRYFVSVLPDAGYAMGGAPVAAGQGAVTVTVNPLPLPTAQISVLVFEDRHPINGAPNPPQEPGLAGFTVVVTEAGGRYGHSGGQVTQDAFGNPLGIIKTGADGYARIKNLPPGKYGIQIVPPAGSDWHQTSTIEGTKTIDAWVKANEPPFFVEFGPPGPHVFVGFVRTMNDTAVLSGGSTVTGRIVNLRTSRPPEVTFYDGAPVPNCWVGLNELPAVGGKGLYTSPCHADSTFSIPNVPPGDYQLVIWDEYLDTIIDAKIITVPPGGGEVDLFDLPVFNWFARIESRVFFDGNQDGFRQADETGIAEQAVNLRFRDGTIYQSFPTDTLGYVPFDEVFPFFNWLVAEVDYARFKATGATVVVDAGGEVPADAGWAMPSWDKLNPQPQSENGGLPYRTETGPVLLEAFQGFLGHTSVIEWGKTLYGPGENGGISGIVYYATTRAENDPRYAAPETWEPGIPRVQVNLYRDFKNQSGALKPDGIIDDVNGDSVVTLADVDNHPLGWRDGSGAKGAEDIDRNNNGTFDYGDALQIATTDSWDDNQPSGCQGDAFIVNGAPTDCFDGLRNFNQVRPGVFDGGYAFGRPAGDPDLPVGTYIVEAITPPGYQHVKEEDKNVDFGDDYTPGPAALPPLCVGDMHQVPAQLSLFPGVDVDDDYANKQRPLCDRKQIYLAQGKNAAVDFFVFTEVPVAAHLVGVVLDDLANEFNEHTPNFGEKFAPPFMPISIRDWTGREISRVYSDQNGSYNALVPSTYSVNLPMPSGVSPNMLETCINSPGPILDTRPGSPTFGQYIIDPQFNRQYSQFCYTFQYMPGTTTYLDTPVVPIAAFAGAGYPLDCEFPDGTPVIHSVNGQNGPWVPAPTTTVQPTLTIVSAESVAVPNPAYDGGATRPQTVLRDYGFGATQGSGKVTLNGKLLQIVSWSNGVISAKVPVGTTTGQLVVTRGNGKPTITALTVTVGGPQPVRVAPGSSIQAAIDAAPNGALILVPPGRYDELVIMHKKVRLQGWGAPSTIINAVKGTGDKLQQWRDKVDTLLQAGQFSLLPGQNTTTAAGLFNTEEGPGVLVVANQGEFTATPFIQRARIDGFTVTNANQGGGVLASGYVKYLTVSNNRIISNQGTYGGGVRVGHPFLVQNGASVDGDNDFVIIRHNHITQNGAGGAAGGGVALCTGSASYQVTDNFICGNFSIANGGGIGHIGLSPGGLIARNSVIFNQSFNQGLGVSGGGLYIAGLPPLAPGGLSAGSGSVNVLGNLIQGNLAGAGDGGGIRTEFTNGRDVQANPALISAWYLINIFNNIITNNIAGLAGGGISLQDSARVNITHNTIANNDSTATAGVAFTPGNTNQSTAQPAGIVARAHSAALFNAISAGTTSPALRTDFSNPTLLNNIVWHNRSFFWTLDNTTVPSTFKLQPGTPQYVDLAVLGSAGAKLNPRFSILTDKTGYAANNLATAPQFIKEYFNGDRGQSIDFPNAISSMSAVPAFDEGGNFIDVRFGPLTLTIPGSGLPYGNYHIGPTSPARFKGASNGSGLLAIDFDGGPRPAPAGTKPDMGADERL